MKVKSLSRVPLFATPWTAAYQAPPSMGFSRQEYWSGVPLPSPFLMYILSQIIIEQEAFWSHTRCQIYIVLPFTSLEVTWIQGSWLTGAHNGILGGHDLLMPMCPTQRNSIQSQRKKTETMLSASLFHWLCLSLWTYISVCVCVCVTLYLHLCVGDCTYICMCGCTYMCVCICTYIYECDYTYICVCVAVPTTVCGCTYICVWAAVPISVCVLETVPTYMCVAVPTYVCVVVCTDVCLHACLSGCLPHFLLVCLYLSIHNPACLLLCVVHIAFCLLLICLWMCPSFWFYLLVHLSIRLHVFWSVTLSVSVCLFFPSLSSPRCVQCIYW